MNGRIVLYLFDLGGAVLTTTSPRNQSSVTVNVGAMYLPAWIIYLP